MIRTRRHAHRGSVLATGFVIDAALVGHAEARRRVLAVWRPGAVVHDELGALVVTGLPVMRVRAERGPGAPVVDQHGVPATLPLDADEAAQLAGPEAIAVSRGGAATAGIAASVARRKRSAFMTDSIRGLASAVRLGSCWRPF